MLVCYYLGHMVVVQSCLTLDIHYLSVILMNTLENQIVEILNSIRPQLTELVELLKKYDWLAKENREKVSNTIKALLLEYFI